MKKTRKMLSLFFAVIMVFCSVPMVASAANLTGTCGENLIWEFDTETGVLTISGTGDMYDFTSASATPWATYNDYISTVIVEDGVTSIGAYAFTVASDVRISKTVETAEQSSFPFGETITIAEDNTCLSIDEHGVVFSGGGTVLLFASKKIRESYIIPEGVIIITDGAFNSAISSNWNTIISVFVSSTVKTMTRNAFAVSDYDTVPYIYVDKNNPYFSSDDYGVLFNKDKTVLYFSPVGYEYAGLPFDYYIIPDTVTEIADNAFLNNNNEKITIPESVVKIGNKSFKTCDGFGINIYIPSSVTFLDRDFTEDASTIYFGGTQTEWNSLYNYCNDDGEPYTFNSVCYEHQHDVVSYSEDCCNFTECAVCKIKFTCDITHIWKYDYDRGFYCSNCNKQTEEKPDSLVCNEHVWDTIDSWEDGCLLLCDYYCSTCGEKKREILKSNHVWFADISESVYCNGGTITYYCEECDTTKEETVEALGHDFVYFSNGNATCLKDGTKTQWCNRCDVEGETVTDEGSAYGHSYPDEWSVITAVSCSQDGVSIKVCSRCHGVAALINNAYGHSDEDADGKCDECAVLLSVTIPEIPEDNEDNETPENNGTTEAPEDTDNPTDTITPDEPVKESFGERYFGWLLNFFERIKAFFANLF